MDGTGEREGDRPGDLPCDGDAARGDMLLGERACGLRLEVGDSSCMGLLGTDVELRRPDRGSWVWTSASCTDMLSRWMP
jgi:hypothetical protein